MKKIFAIMVVICLAFSAQSMAQPPADQDVYTGGGAFEKLQRGMLNLADAVVEIPGTMIRKSKREGLPAGMTFGIVEGAMNTVKRALAGVWEVVTFPIPIPENYAPILPDPEFLSS
jgi:putative exosortase-associated protein (TIGR04073 family)